MTLNVGLITYIFTAPGSLESLLRLDCMQLGQKMISVSDYLPSEKFRTGFDVEVGTPFQVGVPTTEQDLIDFATQQGNLNLYVEGDYQNPIYEKTGKNLTLLSPSDDVVYTGNKFDFGEVSSSGSDAKVFTIKNTSATEALAFTNAGPAYVAISGDAEFAVTTQPTTNPIPAEGTDTLEITFTPAGTGVFSATVEIPTDDPSSPFILRLEGKGV